MIELIYIVLGTYTFSNYMYPYISFALKIYLAVIDSVVIGSVVIDSVVIASVVIGF